MAENDRSDAEQTPPGFPKIPDIRDVIVGELAVNGNWIVVNVETTSYWPVNSQKLRYRSADIWILPVMSNYYPSVAMNVPAGMDREACVRILMQFLSSLSWVQRHGLMANGISGGNLPRPIGREKTRGFSITEEFELTYLPEPTDERATLALALMREGRGLNHPGYAFLSFYRVVEVAIQPKQRAAWIADHLDSITDHRAKQAIAELNANGIVDVGDHIYKTNRQAIAHATKKPIIDPDDPVHGRRLLSEMPIITALAELAIEEVFGVETTSTVYRKHLYELAGFKDLFGLALIEQIKMGDAPDDQRTVDVPTMNVSLRGHDDYAPLQNMGPIQVHHHNGVAHITLRSADGRGRLVFGLDFANERLQFDLPSLVYQDDGSADAAESIAELKRFSKDYIGNGELRIYNSDTGDLLSRKDAFIPMNFFLDHIGAAKDIARWKRVAARRRQWEARPDEIDTQQSASYFIRVLVTYHSEIDQRLDQAERAEGANPCVT